MASQADSVSIFAEGTFEEQILELLNYVARSRPEEERASFIAPFQESLKSVEDDSSKKAVLKSVLKEVNGLGEGSEKEVEGFFNLIYAHLFSLFPSTSPEAKELLESLLPTISSTPVDRLPIAYQVLSNLFNSLPRNSPLRNYVYSTILNLAVSNDDLASLQLSQTEVSKWLSEWDISDDEKAAFLKYIVDAFAKADEPAQSYQYSLQYVQKLSPSSDAAKAAAVQLISDALRLTDNFDFDALFKLDAVVAIKDHELFSLLQVFLNGGLKEFSSWQESHPGVLEKHNLDSAQLQRKIRLLTLASLASQYVGQHLPYAKIAEALQLSDVADVEKWVIDVIRASLVWGKLSQNTQSLLVTRATARSFEREQWEVLEKRLLAWKAGLAGVLEVVANAKRMAGHAPAATAA
ncbi:hypothetical protein D9611_002702 [Ephemerocybe angulata]|uniref:Eukaryotic translation initiation factor 3 subunit M n=1 Tax=Ephemerocybe angulata TaxID=980116 RepID=A0A8H5C418_9AGAR|nr:hypothetical protein D9611_002702 [Tulosesus angulatus]